MEEVAFRRLVEDIRERTDIVALIKETVDLETAGSVLKGRSPFNRDENPSADTERRARGHCGRPSIPIWPAQQEDTPWEARRRVRSRE